MSAARLQCELVCLIVYNPGCGGVRVDLGRLETLQPGRSLEVGSMGKTNPAKVQTTTTTTNIAYLVMTRETWDPWNEVTIEG